MDSLESFFMISPEKPSSVLDRAKGGLKKLADNVRGIFEEESLKKLKKSVDETTEKTFEESKNILVAIWEWLKKPKDVRKMAGAFLGFFSGLADMGKSERPDGQEVPLSPPKEEAPPLNDAQRMPSSDTEGAKTPSKTQAEAERPKPENMAESQEINDTAKGVIFMAYKDKERVEAGGPPDRKNCWDWVEKIFEQAGVKRKIIVSRTNSPENPYKFMDFKEVKSLIRSGDHLFVCNQNEYDKSKNHSVIFLGWVNKQRGDARVISSWVGASAPREQTINLDPEKFKEGNRRESSKPVTFVSRPVNKRQSKKTA